MLQKENQELDAEKSKLKEENEGLQGELKGALSHHTKLTIELEVRMGVCGLVRVLRCLQSPV